jgi:phospholipid-translocating ATPase
MVVAELISLASYFLSLYIFRSYFDPAFLGSWAFVWRVLLATVISCIPLYILKFIQIKFYPPVHRKLAQYSTLK